MTELSPPAARAARQQRRRRRRRRVDRPVLDHRLLVVGHGLLPADAERERERERVPHDLCCKCGLSSDKTALITCRCRG